MSFFFDNPFRYNILGGIFYEEEFDGDRVHSGPERLYGRAGGGYHRGLQRHHRKAEGAGGQGLRLHRPVRPRQRGHPRPRGYWRDQAHDPQGLRGARLHRPAGCSGQHHQAHCNIVNRVVHFLDRSKITSCIKTINAFYLLFLLLFLGCNNDAPKTIVHVLVINNVNYNLTEEAYNSLSAYLEFLNEYYVF